ncbi:unnamed protein product [Closterium sp. Yama58-4]|nr:unnamed protein product [Closterium sp. Yama58-4]
MVDAYRALNPGGQERTFYSRAQKSSLRIDRILVSAELLPSVAEASHPRPLKGISDHKFGVKVVLQANLRLHMGPGLWRMPAADTAKPGAERVIQAVTEWHQASGSGSFGNLLTKLKLALRRYTTEERKRIRATLRHLEEAVTVLQHGVMRDPKNDALRTELAAKEAQLEAYLRGENDRLQLLAGERELAKGEIASKVLSAKVKMKKAKTSIAALSYQGTEHSGTRGILEAASDFYTSLFAGAPPSGLPCWKPEPGKTLREEEAACLEGAWTEKEVLKALKDIAKDKAPGSDGLPKELFERHWDLLKKDFMGFIRNFESTAALSVEVQEAVTVLLHKKGPKELKQNYRPITLLTSSYKVVARLLANRMRSVLDRVISKEQCGFLPGRRLSDAVSLVADVIEAAKNKDKDWYILMVDFQKALMVNGWLGDQVAVGKGVRQGCPLAPYLFLCAVEPICQEAKRRKLGISNDYGERLAYLGYADDTTLVLKGKQQITRSGELLEDFGARSGLMVNKEKSAILPLGKNLERIKDDGSAFAWVASKNAERLLGVWVSPSGGAEVTWDKTLARAAEELLKWQSHYLTTTAHVAVINCYVCPILAFQGQVYPPSEAVWKRIMKLLVNFISGNQASEEHRFTLWSRELIFRPRKEGGLGVRDPFVELSGLAARRVATLVLENGFRKELALAAADLPEDFRSFLAHKDSLKQWKGRSVRWRQTCELFMKSKVALREPESRWDIEQEPLVFNRHILPNGKKPLGKQKAAQGLELYRLKDFIATAGDGTRSVKTLETLTREMGTKKKAQRALNFFGCVPESWKVKLLAPLTEEELLAVSEHVKVVGAIGAWKIDKVEHGGLVCRACDYAGLPLEGGVEKVVTLSLRGVQPLIVLKGRVVGTAGLPEVRLRVSELCAENQIPPFKLLRDLFEVAVGKGVRQGCPLAPYLFLCAVEPICQEAKRRKLGISNDYGERLAYLGYADDTTLVLKGKQQITRSGELLEDFGARSGLMVNKEKSAILPLGKNLERIKDDGSAFAWVASKNAERLLGVWVSPSGGAEVTWDKTLARAAEELLKWQSHYLTTTAHVAVINCYVCPILAFQGQVYPPSEAVWKRIMKLLVNFISGNQASEEHRFTLWSRELIFRPRKEGGLGVRDPFVELSGLAARRVATLVLENGFRKELALAAADLPEDFRSFLAHKDSLKQWKGRSVRWRQTCELFMKSKVALREPESRWDIEQEPLVFNRHILPNGKKPLGKQKAAQGLELYRLKDFIATAGDGTRSVKLLAPLTEEKLLAVSEHVKVVGAIGAWKIDKVEHGGLVCRACDYAGLPLEGGVEKVVTLSLRGVQPLIVRKGRVVGTAGLPEVRLRVSELCAENQIPPFKLLRDLFEVAVGKGVRQGCPLAPYLFLCAVEPICQEAKRRKLGISNDYGERLAYLGYADDTTLVLKGKQQITRSGELLEDFGARSGLMVNKEKSAILPLGKNLERIKDDGSAFAWVASKNAERLLGVWVSPSGGAEVTWDKTLARAAEELLKWQSHYLTTTAHVAVINCYVCPILAFQGQVYPPSEAVWKRIMKLLVNFISGNQASEEHRFTLWSRELIFRPRKEGGLGVRDPFVELSGLAARRVATLVLENGFRKELALAAADLPEDFRSFLAHKDSLKQWKGRSVRWRQTCELFMKSKVALREPESRWDIEQEPLVFNRHILPNGKKPLGKQKAAQGLELYRLKDFIATAGDGTRSVKTLETLTREMGTKKKAQRALNFFGCVPESWKVKLLAPLTEEELLAVSEHVKVVGAIGAWKIDKVEHGGLVCRACDYAGLPLEGGVEKVVTLSLRGVQPLIVRKDSPLQAAAGPV